MNESEDLKKPDKELAGCYFFEWFFDFFFTRWKRLRLFSVGNNLFGSFDIFFGGTICGIVGGITSGIIIIWLFESSKEICWDNIKFLLVLFFFKLQLEREKLLKDIFEFWNFCTKTTATNQNISKSEIRKKIRNLRLELFSGTIWAIFFELFFGTWHILRLSTFIYLHLSIYIYLSKVSWHIYVGGSGHGGQGTFHVENQVYLKDEHRHIWKESLDGFMELSHNVLSWFFTIF